MEKDEHRMNQSVTYYTLHHSDGLVAFAFPAFSFAQAVTIKNNLQAEYNEKHHCYEVFEMREITRKAFERHLKVATEFRLARKN